MNSRIREISLSLPNPPPFVILQRKVPNLVMRQLQFNEIRLSLIIRFTIDAALKTRRVREYLSSRAENRVQPG